MCFQIKNSHFHQTVLYVFQKDVTLFIPLIIIFISKVSLYSVNLNVRLRFSKSNLVLGKYAALVLNELN